MRKYIEIHTYISKYSARPASIPETPNIPFLRVPVGDWPCKNGTKLFFAASQNVGGFGFRDMSLTQDKALRYTSFVEGDEIMTPLSAHIGLWHRQYT